MYNRFITYLRTNIYFISSIVFVVTFSIAYYQTDRNGDIVIKGFGQWYDLPVHIKYINHLIYNQPGEWLSHHPLNYNETFRYHFLTDLLSALLLRSGLSLRMALTLPITIFTILALLTMRKFFLRYKSIRVVDLSILGFIFFGGFGFLFFPEWLTQRYVDPNMFQIGDVAYNFLLTPLTQIIYSHRGIILGTFLFFLAINTSYHAKTITDYTRIFVLLLILAFSQFHGILAITLYFASLQKADIKKQRLIPLFLSLVATAIVYFSFFYSPTTLSYIKPNLLWLFNWQNWSQYLLSNLLSFGLFGIIYLATVPKNSDLPQFGRFPLIMLILINLIQFQPNEWDNIKLLWFTLPFMSLSVVSFLDRRMGHKPVVFAISILALVGTGLCSFGKMVFTNKNDYTLITASELATGSRIRALLDGKMVVIENKHNHLVTIGTNSTLYSSYFPVLRTYGHNIDPTWHELVKVWRGDDMTSYLNDHKIDYLITYKGDLYSQEEMARTKWFMGQYLPIKANTEALKLKYPIVYEDGIVIIFNPSQRNYPTATKPGQG